METQDLLVDIEQEAIIVHATVGQRFANYIIDLICIYILIFAVAFFGSWIAGSPIVDDNSPALLIGCIAVFLYYSFFEGVTKGRSPGKLITRTKVVREDGSVPTFGDILKRSVSRLAPFEVLSTFGGHPWHDKWTRTYVIKVN